MIKNETARIGLLGFVGGTLGLVHHIMFSHVTDASGKLTIPYTHLNKDAQLVEFLRAIEPISRTVDIVSYVRIVQTIDELIGMKENIQKNGGTLVDHVAVYRKIQRIKLSMNRIQEVLDEEYAKGLHSSSNVQYSPRDIIYIQKTMQHITTVLNSYLKVVISLTSDDRIQ